MGNAGRNKARLERENGGATGATGAPLWRGGREGLAEAGLNRRGRRAARHLYLCEPHGHAVAKGVGQKRGSSKVFDSRSMVKHRLTLIPFGMEGESIG